MSITPFVNRVAPALLLTVVLGVAATVVTPVTGSAAPAPAPAPAVKPETDPATRVASLSTLVASRTQALQSAQARRNDLGQRLTAATAQEAAAQARSDQSSVLAAQAAARYAKSKARLALLAAAAYRDGSTVSPITQLFKSDSAATYAYRHELVRRVGEQQRSIIATATRDRAAAKRTAAAAAAERDRLEQLVASLTHDVPASDAAVNAATAARDRAQFWLARWQAIIGGPNTTIMGPTLLSADELSTWFTGTRHQARTTVPIDVLATYYVEEGTAVNVRADIAFAQSMLETGGFSYPAGGQVLGTDNNFAGMGACDSCHGGNVFPDARTGVRAQLQQLRVYADPNLTNAELNPPAVNPKLDQHHLKGKVPTWAGLTHTWATANAYGDRILQIYEQMLGWLTDRARF
jgi:hypothetical protein